MRVARIVDDIVIEVLDLPEGLALADAFSPGLGFEEVHDQVDEGMVRVGDSFEIPGLPQPSLNDVKAALKLGVDQAAEIERLKYITPGAGQAMTYQAKVDEVRALAQDLDPDAANYPLLAAEIGITAESLQDVAAAVLGAYRQWQQLGAVIERARLGAKAEIDAATTQEEARAAVDAVTWPGN